MPIVVLFVNFRLDYLLQNQLDLVHKQRDYLVNSPARAVQAFHSLRHSHSQLLEAACLQQKQQHLLVLEVSEQREQLASVCVTIFSPSTCRVYCFLCYATLCVTTFVWSFVTNALFTTAHAAFILDMGREVCYVVAVLITAGICVCLH